MRREPLEECGDGLVKSHFVSYFTAKSELLRIDLGALNRTPTPTHPQ